MKNKLIILSLAAIAIVACSDSNSSRTASPKKAVRTEKLEPYECGTIERLHTLNGVFLASQPAVEDFQHAKDGGVKTVIDFRKSTESRPFDEPSVVTGLGLEYVNLGFDSPATLTDDIFDRARGLLRDESKRPMLVHCHSGNRVGAIWLAHRVLDGGLSWDAAALEAKDVGLKSPTFEVRAKEYVEQHAHGVGKSGAAPGNG